MTQEIAPPNQEMANFIESPTVQPGVSPAALQQKTPIWLRVLEVLLIVFILYRSWVFTSADLFFTHGSQAWRLFSNTDLTYMLVDQVGSLGFLGYVLFRNWRTRRNPTSDTIGILALEVALIVYLAFSISILNSFREVSQGLALNDAPDSSRVLGYGILFQVGKLASLGYVLYRGSRSFRSLGLHWTKRDVAMALPLGVAACIIRQFCGPLALWISQIVGMYGLPAADFTDEMGAVRFSAMWLGSMILNGFYEELIVRAFLMTGIRRLTNSAFLTIGCSVAFQVSYHFYQGTPSALLHTGTFLIFAVYYWRTNRILPVILAHNFVNLTILLLRAGT